MQAYLLFDAALLAGTKELSELLEQPELIALYGDLGPGALEVGPLLIATSRVQELAQNLVVRRGAKERWACSQLITRARLEDLVEHLHGLRLVRARDDREFYFRYADGRAFQAMWQVLSDEQRVSLMGPIQSWQCVALDGTASRRVPPPIELSAEQARVPLHLAPPQWHALLGITRVEELKQATELLARTAQPPCAGDDLARRNWTRETYRLLGRYDIDSQLVRVTANLVMWQTAGRFARDAVFHVALRDAERNGQIDYLRSFGALGPV